MFNGLRQKLHVMLCCADVIFELIYDDVLYCDVISYHHHRNSSFLQSNVEVDGRVFCSLTIFARYR